MVITTTTPPPPFSNLFLSFFYACQNFGESWTPPDENSWIRAWTLTLVSIERTSLVEYVCQQTNKHKTKQNWTKTNMSPIIRPGGIKKWSRVHIMI